MIVVNDRRELYPEILERAGLRLDERYRRHVNRRTGRRAGEFFEDVLVARGLGETSTFGTKSRHRHVRPVAPSVATCSRAPSRMRSSGSSRAASRSRRTSSAACPAFAIVGLADRACQEAKERVRSGIASAELEWPVRRITVNLAPAELRKEGSGFDLPIALAVLAASRQVPAEALRGHAAVGELALDGRVRPVGGVLAAAEGARRAGLARLLCAAESARRGGARRDRAGSGRTISPRRSRTCAASAIRRRPTSRVATAHGAEPAGPDLADVRGQERARRALELAAAGGTTCCSRARPGRARRCSPAGCPGSCRRSRRRGARGDADPLGRRAAPARPAARRAPPFRAPHHTASTAAIVGGGPAPRPGEASLAHRGVLLLDELAEFPRPRSRRCASRSRTARRDRARRRAVVFPARFQLVGTMNLCPCGARGDPAAECSCSRAAARRLPRQALARAARPLRPRRHGAAAACGELAGGARRSARWRSRARVAARAHAASRAGAAQRTHGGGRAARPRGRAAAAVRRAAARGSRASRGRSPRSRRRGGRRPSTSPRRSPTARRAELGRRERARRWPRSRPRRARTSSPSRASGASSGSAAPSTRIAISPTLEARGLRFVGRRDARVSRRCCASSTTRRPGCSCAARARSSCSGDRPSRSSARAPARPTARRSRGCSGASSPAPGSSSSAASPAAIDGEAHRGALEAGGPTVAVLGCGIDRDYPAAHAQLARAHLRTGPRRLGVRARVEPAPWRFPARNRIVAGLAAATVVVEARERSGALITADFALEAGREVFAVPGEITSALSVGANALLRLGATP